MAFVVAGSTITAGSSVDVTLDVGSSANRKAIAICGHQNVAAATLGSASRDPAGTAQSMTRAASSSVLNSGDAFYISEIFYLDLSVSGSQTFRYDAGANGLRTGMAVIVWDDMAAGAAEAIDDATASAGTSVSHAVTTLTNNAVVFSGVASGAVSATAPTWTPDNGQTERADLAVTVFQLAAGDIVVGTAGSQTVGWTNAVSQNVFASTLAAFEVASAPTPSPGTLRTIVTKLNDIL